MIIKRRTRRTVPGLNTASLPDLIFTVLFFFMIVTHMRNVTPNVDYEVPKGNNLSQVVPKTSIIYVYVGKSLVDNNPEYQIQINDKIVDFSNFKQAILNAQKALKIEDETLTTIALKADKDCPMSVIKKIKQALREVNILRISYNATYLKPEKVE